VEVQIEIVQFEASPAATAKRRRQRDYGVDHVRYGYLHEKSLSFYPQHPSNVVIQIIISDRSNGDSTVSWVKPLCLLYTAKMLFSYLRESRNAVVQATRMPCICTWVHANAGTQQSPHPHPLSLHFHKSKAVSGGLLGSDSFPGGDNSPKISRVSAAEYCYFV
jgi:hypothetical protein